MSFNLAVILTETARSSPDYAIAVFAGGRLTYRVLDEASDRLAASLTAAGIGPGDPVALQLPNIPALPLFHVFDLSSILNCCVRFACTSLIPRFAPAAALEAIQRDRITILRAYLPCSDPDTGMG